MPLKGLSHRWQRTSCATETGLTGGVVKEESVAMVVGEVRVLPGSFVPKDRMEKEEAVVDGDGLERASASQKLSEFWPRLIAWLGVTTSITLRFDRCVGKRNSRFKFFSISADSPKMDSKVVA